MASGIRWTMEAPIRPQGTAGTTQNTALGRCKRAGILAVTRLLPYADVAGDANNWRLFTLQNRGQDGTGTTVMATWSTDSDVVGQGSLVDFDEHAMALSGTAANLVVAEGDVLALVETVGGTGVAHGGAHLELAFDPVN